MKILVLGYLVPDELVDEICRTDRMPPMQAHRYLKGLAEALDSASDRPIDMISALPLNDYPHSKRLFAGFRRWTRRRNALWWGMPFINVFPLKHLTRFVSGFVLTSVWCIRNLRQKRCIVVASAATPGLTAGWLAAKLFGAKLVPCLMDPPSVALPTDGGIKSYSRRLDRWIAKKVLARSDGLIAVTQPMADLFGSHCPTTVFEGVAAISEQGPSEPREEVRFVSAYAGSLGRAYGIPLLLEAFRQLDPERHVLWVFGKGECEPDVLKACLECPNIHFFGFLTDGLDARLRSADLLLMVRPSEGDDSAYCFPNKIHYSMALGVSTAITPLKGLGQEYFDNLLLLDDSTSEALAASIDTISKKDPRERLLQAQRMLDFVRKEKSPSAMGVALVQFLREVTEGVTEPHEVVPGPNTSRKATST